MNTPTPEEGATVEELFLFHLRYKQASLISVGANKPILLSDPETSWIVYSGYVDIFAVEVENEKAAGPRSHLFRVEPGQGLFSVDLSDGNPIGFLAVGGNETRLLKLPTKRLQEMGREGEYKEAVASLLNNWVQKISRRLSPSLPPKECVRLETDHALTLPPAGSVCAKKQILWVQHKQGQSRFMGNPALPGLNGNVRYPLSNHTWLETLEESEFNGIDTATYLRQNPTWSDLRHFHNLVRNSIALTMREVIQLEKQRLNHKLVANRQVIENAISHLASPLASREEQVMLAMDTREPLLQACQLVGGQLGMEIQTPPETYIKQSKLEPVEEVARASRFRVRRVALKGRWWKGDHGPLLGFRTEDEQPVALLPVSGKRYELNNPQTRQKMIVTEEIADTLDQFAYAFYRPFPERAISGWEMIRFGLKGQGRDLRTLLLSGAAVGLLALMVPVATGIIFNRIVPNAERSQLLQLSLLLFVIAIASAMFQVTQNIAVLRLRGRLSMKIQSALWDRLLNLPASFFRNYTAGDLGVRVMGINAIEQTLSDPVIGAFLMGIFSIFSFLLLFIYDTGLAIIATLLTLILIIAVMVISRAQIRYQRQAVELQGKISGTVLQAITGINKFRAAGAESRAFASWAQEFSQLKQTAYKARDNANKLAVFNAGFYVLIFIVIFGAVALSSQRDLATGTFLAFNAAFIQFFISALMLSTTFIATLNIVPTFERVRPILETPPEVDELKVHPGELTGQLEVSHLSFRYYEDAPLVLDGVSLHAEPGEFVALVGPSGSGKSTLFRLLLGFERPTSGIIYYDGYDLAGLDSREVRRQIGVVLQNGQLMTGDIYTNIIGSSLLTANDAWEAIRMAGLEDDIKQMPMGLHTVISAGGGTLSGGQRQRLLIARAIVHKPRLLFFDEATSALDSRTQAMISESLENLQATRIVIAHRLSTIVNADRIYVLEHGRVAQAGTYEELINQPGPFAELAKRQIA